MESFLEARKFSSSKSHHRIIHSGASVGHTNPKTVIIVVCAVVVIVLVIGIFYCVIHHHEYKKARHVQSKEQPISHIKIGKKAALTAVTFGLIQLWRNKRRGKHEAGNRDVDEEGVVPLVAKQEEDVVAGGLYREGGTGKSGIVERGYTTSDEVAEEKRMEKLIGMER